MVDDAVKEVLTSIAGPPQSNRSVRTILDSSIGSYSFQFDEAKTQLHLAYDEFAQNNDLQLWELLHEAAYGETSPLGASIFALNTGKICIDSVLAYRRAQFVAGNVTVAANGVSYDRLKGIVAAHSGAISKNAPAAVAASPYTGGEVRVRRDLDGLTKIGLAFPVPAGEAGKLLIAAGSGDMCFS